MSFKTNHITDQFKNTFIRFRSRTESERAQKLMFRMGFKWRSEDRNIRHYSTNGYLMVDKECRVHHASYNGDYAPSGREITLFQLRQAADQVSAIRKARRKDSRARKAGWILHNGGACPVARDTRIDVKYRDGSTLENARALSIEDRNESYYTTSSAFWNHDNFNNDIVAYRLSKSEHAAPTADGWVMHDASAWTGKDHEVPEALQGTEYELMLQNGEVVGSVRTFGTDCDFDYQVKAYRIKQEPAKTVTLAEMVDDVVKQDGWAEVQRVDADGWIVNTGTCPVEKGVLVDVKYRDGDVEMSVPALTFGTGKPEATDWKLDGVFADIVAYRIVPQKVEPEVEATPDTNPKKQYGLASIPLNLWSPLASAYGALSLYCGSLKYGRCNYMASPVEASIYIAAAMRHLNAWAEGEEFDPADGCPNLGGVLANIAILLEARAAGTLIDDRQMTGGYLKERDNLKALVGKLQVLHADKDPRHYTIADNKVV